MHLLWSCRLSMAILKIITDASVRHCAVSESMLADFLTVIPHTVAAAGADKFLDPSASLVLDPSNDGQRGVAVDGASGL